MLVDDHHLAVLDDVVLVALEQLLGLDRVVEVAHVRRVHRVVEVVDAEVVLDLLDPRLQHADGALLLVDLVVALDAQQPHDLGELGVPAGGVAGGGTGDDQRRAGLVDEDRVDLVDDREVVAALHQLGRGPRHVVAQVVEAELGVGAVGDVAVVLHASLVRAHRVEHAADAQAEEPVHAAHQVGLVLGQVVVDGDDVDALAGERVEVGRQRRDEGLALAGLHLGDVALVQGRPAHELHVEVPLAERAVGGLAHGRERLGQQVVERLAVGDPRPEPVGLLAQLGVGHRDEVVLERVDLAGERLQIPDDPALAGAQNLDRRTGHVSLRLWSVRWFRWGSAASHAPSPVRVPGARVDRRCPPTGHGPGWGACSSPCSAPPPAPVTRSCCARHRDGDADALVRMYADEQVHRWLSGPPVPFLPEHARSWGRRPGSGVAGGDRRRVDLDGRPRRRARGPAWLRPRGDGAFDVGYVLGRDAWGRGAMSAALREAARWAFAPAADGGADAETLLWQAQVGNWASRRVAWACGVRVEGRVRGLLPHRGRRSTAGPARCAAVTRPASGRAVAGGARDRGGRPAAAPQRAGRRRADRAGLRAPDHAGVAVGPARPVRPGRGPALPRDRAGGPGPRRRRALGRRRRRPARGAARPGRAERPRERAVGDRRGRLLGAP